MESDEWSFRADRCATPAVFANGTGFVTAEESPLGQTGVGFAYRDGSPLLRLHFPYREEPLRYDGSEAPAPPDVRVHRWSPGEFVVLEFALYELDDDPHAYASVLRDVNERAGDAADPGWISVEEA